MAEKVGFDPVDLVGIVNRNAERNSPEEDGDYTDEEGYLVCGKCHTRRQTEIELTDISHPGEKTKMKVRINCKCRQDEEDRRREEERVRKEMEIVMTLKRQSLMDDRLTNATFDSFEKTKDNARNLMLCRRYAEHFDEMLEKNQGLLFYGAVGTGKTFAAACIANHLLDRQRPVVMTSFVKLLDAMQTFKEEDSVLISRLNRAKLLIIDDLGTERSTDFALEKVYNIVDSRYRAKLPIILTTNLRLEDMKEAVDMRYARIYDRIFELCYPMQFSGPSWRKKEASKRFHEMQAFMEGKDDE